MAEEKKEPSVVVTPFRAPSHSNLASLCQSGVDALRGVVSSAPDPFHIMSEETARMQLQAHTTLNHPINDPTLKPRTKETMHFECGRTYWHTKRKMRVTIIRASVRRGEHGGVYHRVVDELDNEFDAREDLMKPL